MNQGFLVIGVVQLSTGWILACYPRTLPKKPALERELSTVSAKPTPTKPAQRTFKSSYQWKQRNIYWFTWMFNSYLDYCYNPDFPAALRRLLTNKVLILNNLAGVFFVFALSGYITFLPKYMETQFQQTASRSGLVNGTFSSHSWYLTKEKWINFRFCLYRSHWHFVHVHRPPIGRLSHFEIPTESLETSSIWRSYWDIVVHHSSRVCLRRMQL